MSNEQSSIPPGTYCYTRINGEFVCCPYWATLKDKPEQENGYCEFLRISDEDINRRGDFGLLWDGVKECGINMDRDFDTYPMGKKNE